MSRPKPAQPYSRAKPQTNESTSGRIDSNNGRSTPILGKVYWAPVRSLWFTLMYGGALLGGYATFRWDALALCLFTSAIALCAGYSVGIHRRLIHSSFQCHIWVEAVLVYIGVLVGIGGPFTLIERHDIREWAQSQPHCHSYFTGRQNPFTDWLWTMHCVLQLQYPPIVRDEPRLTYNKFYQWLEQTWMFQQLPLAIAFYYYGGWSWLFWGIYVRISLCATLIWLADYLACRQNNHQDTSYSARFGGRSQLDPGWWLIKGLQSLGLAWNIPQPQALTPVSIKAPNAESSIATVATVTTIEASSAHQRQQITL